MRWYITVAAVRDYMRICGYGDDTDGPQFDRAAKELSALSEEARLAKDVGTGSRNQTQQWRVNASVHGRRTRLEMNVSIEPRPEGELPQLVAVRKKG